MESAKATTTAGRRAGLLAALATVLAVLFGTATPAAAHGTGWPHHQSRGVSCEHTIAGATVKAYPPRDVRSWGNRRDDVAYWRTVLYRWSGTQWVQVNRTGWVSYAYVNPYGLSQGRNPGWRSRTTHGQLLFVPFFRQPRGSYTVLDQLMWHSTGQVHSHWSPNSCAL